PINLLISLVETGQWTLELALAYARRVPDASRCVQALAILMRAMNDASQKSRIATEALAAARGIGDEEARVKALADLAPHLGEARRRDALELARGLGHDRYRAEALGALAPHLGEAQRRDALELARGLGDGWARARALAALAPHLGEAQRRDALELARGLGD